MALIRFFAAPDRVGNDWRYRYTLGIVAYLAAIGIYLFSTVTGPTGLRSSGGIFAMGVGLILADNDWFRIAQNVPLKWCIGNVNRRWCGYVLYCDLAA
jgi:hypothetical protein